MISALTDESMTQLGKVCGWFGEPSLGVFKESAHHLSEAMARRIGDRWELTGASYWSMIRRCLRVEQLHGAWRVTIKLATGTDFEGLEMSWRHVRLEIVLVDAMLSKEMYSEHQYLSQAETNAVELLALLKAR